MTTIHTNRLDLIATTIEHLDAEGESPAKLEILINSKVPSGWPPGEYDRGAMEFFKAQLEKNPENAGWYGWYAVLRAVGEEPATLIGAGGFFGPPRESGLVEIGYSVVQDYEGKGYATELVGALATYAFADVRVRKIIAHTTPENIGSWRVLERCGFLMVGPGRDAGTIQYALARPAS